jgi:GntR family phosphonate transport system transcriptional regulator
MGVTRKEGRALWHQIERALGAEIEACTLRLGDRLPTEPVLMQRFGVSRFTVRQAIANLERRGLVRAEQGRGTFVHRDVLSYPISRRTRFSRNLIEQGFDPGGEVFLQEVVAADQAVAAALHLMAGAPVAHRRGVGTANGIPIELASVYVSDERFPDFAQVRNRHATYTATFAAYGIADYVRMSTTIETRLPTPEEARTLRQPDSAPVLVVTRVDADTTDTPILFGQAVWNGERVAFELIDDGAEISATR